MKTLLKCTYRVLSANNGTLHLQCVQTQQNWTAEGQNNITQTFSNLQLLGFRETLSIVASCCFPFLANRMSKVTTYNIRTFRIH